jgi:RND family efflux transporter MFP subunit
MKKPQNCVWLPGFLLAGGMLMPMVATALQGELDCVISPKSTIKLGSPEEGILAELQVDRGDRVKKGDLLARLDSELESLAAELAGLRARSDTQVRSGRAQTAFRRKEVERLEEMHAQKTVPGKVYDEAKIESRLAELSFEEAKIEHGLAEVEHRRAKAVLERRNVRSPVDGVVVEVMMSPGEYVNEQTPLMRIAEIDPLNVEVFIPVADYGSINLGMEADVNPETPAGASYRAKVTVVDSVFDAASRTFGVRLELANSDYALPAGMRCTVRFLPAGTATPAGE